MQIRKKKPTQSFANADEADDDNDDSDRLTVGTVLNGYGVSKANVGFVLDAIYNIALAFVLLVRETICATTHVVV